MEDIVIPIVACVTLFIGLPWLVFHYITQWKRTGGISREDEQLLDDLHALARRLDDRLRSIERIMAADNPEFAARTRAASREEPGLDRYENGRDR